MKGATRRGNLIRRTHTDFNPRTHEGCDFIKTRIKSYFNYFNPRTHEGCDDVPLSSSITANQFQSTHP